MNKSGKGIGMSTIAILAVLVVGGIYLYMNPGILGAPQELAIVAPQKADITCSSNTTPELKFVVNDSINEGTLRTDSFDANVYLNGSYNGGYHLASDNTADVSPGDGYALFIHQSGANTTYFGDVITGNVPCEELVTINASAATVGSLTLTAYNSDNELANSETDREPVGTGEAVNVSFKLKETTADACLGTDRSTKNMVLCFDYNSSSWKQPVMKVGGASASAVETPAGHSALRNAVQDTTACFDTQTKSICDYGEKTGFSLQLEALSNINPQAGVGDVNVHLYMPQVFQDSETGDWDWYLSDRYNSTQIITPKTGKINVE